MIIDKGYVIKDDSGLIHWDQLLKAWTLLIKYYCDFMEGDDAPYYYTERANAGVLAAAAWKIGWICLQEFGVSKRGKFIGFGDLYIYPKGREKAEYIEVKLAWNIKGGSATLNKALGDAKKCRHPKDESYISIGVAFICPGINIKYGSQGQIDKKIKIWIDEAATISCDAFAWSFPKSVRHLTGKYNFSHIIYPGVILLAKVASSSK